MIRLRRVISPDSNRDTSHPPRIEGAVYYVRHEGRETSVYSDVELTRLVSESGEEWRARIVLPGPTAPSVPIALAELGRWMERLGRELQTARGGITTSIPLEISPDADPTG